MESAWSRLGADATVVFSSPVQVPAMAVRDAVFFSDDPWENTVAFPLTLPAFLVWHTSLAALHLVDLGAAPLHFLDERGPPRIYQPYAFPMPYHEDAAIGEEAGQMLLYGVGFVGGAVGAYYFATEYLPRALKVPGS